MITLYPCLEHRRTIRRYLEKPVEPEKLDRIARAAALAPSAHHTTPWHLTIVTDPAAMRRLAEAMAGAWDRDMLAGGGFRRLDRALKTDLKIEVRGIKPVEERIADRSDPASQVVKDYATALRAVLLEDGRPPFDLPGVKVYESLDEISQSLQRCLAKKGLQNWKGCSEWPCDTSNTGKHTKH